MTEERAASALVEKWLVANQPGYDDLTGEERQAIADFSILWTVFERRLLCCEASMDKMQRLARRMIKRERLQLDQLQPAMEHFRDRYFRDDEFTDKFCGLRFDDQRQPEPWRQMAKDFVSGTARHPEAIIVGVLAIIYRLRNNLFHGEKWRYEFRDQRENLIAASRVMMDVMTMAGTDLMRRSGCRV